MQNHQEGNISNIAWDLEIISCHMMNLKYAEKKRLIPENIPSLSNWKCQGRCKSGSLISAKILKGVDPVNCITS